MTIFPLPDRILTVFILCRSSSGNHRNPELIGSVMFRRYCEYQYFLTFDSYNPSTSSSMVLRLWERCDIDYLFVAENFTNMYSL